MHTKANVHDRKTERKGGKTNKHYVRSSIKMDKLTDKINRTDRQTSKQ